MRIFGLGGRVMSQAGATTVLLPGGDLAAAFAANKIDAAELYTPAVDESQPLKDKVKLIYVPGWHQPETVLELIINKDRWDRLSQDQRDMINDSCRANLQATLAESAALQSEALADLTAKNGVRVEQWPDAVLSALRSAWADVAKEEAEQDYFFKTVLDDITAFRQAAESASAPAPSAGTDSPPPPSTAEAKPAP